MADQRSDRDRHPAIVGAATLVGRPDDPEALDAVGWMTDAARVALLDATDLAGSAVALADHVRWVGVAEGTWRCSDAGAVLADRLALGAGSPVHTVRADIGILQQRLIAEACGALQRGETEAALVVGGEARARDRAISKRGGEPTHTAGPDGAEPDEVLHPAGALMSDLELERHLATPATQYAIVEDALAHHDGLDRAALRRRLGDLWAGFAEVAAANPNAWNRAAPSGEEITGTAGGNRMVAEPYTRSLCSQWNVDAASAVVIASEGLADRLGLDPRRCVPVEATAESNLIVPLPQRAEPDRWPAFEAVIAALAAHLDVPVDGGLGADVVDLYACFPSAVQVQARALGLPIVAESLTATGGMTFAGGPLNNAALASTVAVVERLRSPGLAETAARGLVTSISGMLTKPGAMTLRSGAAAVPFVALDVTAEATRRTGTVEVSAELAGPAVVVGATVVPTFEGGDRVVALVRAEGRGGAVHSVATSERAEEVERVRTAGGAGTAVVLDGVGGMRLAAGPSGPEVALRSG